MLTGLFIMQTLQVYYARDVLGSADYTIVLTVLTTGAMFVVSPAIPKIVETFGKKRAYLVAGAVAVPGGIGIALTPPSVPFCPSSSSLVYGIGIAAVQALMWALQADTVEYGEWESGVRTEGTQLRGALVHPQGRPGHRRGAGRIQHRAGRLRRRIRRIQTPGALDTIRYLTGGGTASSSRSGPR